MPRWLAHTLLLAVLASSLWLHGQWIVRDRAVLEIDAVDHIQAFQKYRFVHGDPLMPLSERLRGLFSYQYFTSVPPLLFWLTWPAVGLFGSSLIVARLIAVLCLALFLISIYLLAGRLGGPWAAIAAVLLAAGFADVALLGHVYGTFLLAPTCVTLVIWALLRSQNFTRAPWCGLAGALLACALWSERGIPALYLAAPVGLLVLRSLRAMRRGETGRLKPLLGMLLALILPALAATPFVLGYLQTNSAHNADMISQPLYPYRDQWYYYLKKGPRIVLGYAHALLFVAALIFAFVRRLQGRWLLALWIAAPLAFFSAVATKDFVYLAGLTPAAAVLMGLLIANLSSLRRRLLVLIPVVLLGALQTAPRLIVWPWLNELVVAHPGLMQWQGPAPSSTLPIEAKPLEPEVAGLLERRAVDERPAFLICYCGRRNPAGGVNPENEAKRLQMVLTFARPWSVTLMLYGDEGMLLTERSMARAEELTRSVLGDCAATRMQRLSHAFDALHLVIGAYGRDGFQGFPRAKDRREGGNIIAKNPGSLGHQPFVVKLAALDPEPIDRISTTGDLKILVWRDRSAAAAAEEVRK